MYIHLALLEVVVRKSSPPNVDLGLVYFMLVTPLWENRLHYCSHLMKTTELFDYGCRLPIVPEAILRYTDSIHLIIQSPSRMKEGVVIALKFYH